MARKLFDNIKWGNIEAMLPRKASASGVSTSNDLRFIEAALRMARTGTPCVIFPQRLGNWHNMYTLFISWRKHSRSIKSVNLLGELTKI